MPFEQSEFEPVDKAKYLRMQGFHVDIESIIKIKKPACVPHR